MDGGGVEGGSEVAAAPYFSSDFFFKVTIFRVVL